MYAKRTAAGDQSGDSTRAFRLIISITLADGTTSTVVTKAGAESQWKARHGPIVYDHLWHGEIFDTGQILAPWGPAKKMSPKAGRMYPQLMPPIVNFSTLKVAEFCSNDMADDMAQTTVQLK